MISRITLHGFPAATVFGGTSWSTTLIDPFCFEPMKRTSGVAAKPHLAPFYGAPACRLINEGFRHQSNLVEQQAGQRDTLDKVLAAFIPSAEDVEGILHVSTTDYEHIVSTMVLYGVSPALEHQFKRCKDIPPKAAYRLSAHGKILSIETGHRPETEGERHRQRLSGPDRTIGDDTLLILDWALIRPPVQKHPLMSGEFLKFEYCLPHVPNHPPQHFQVLPGIHLPQHLP